VKGQRLLVLCGAGGVVLQTVLEVGCVHCLVGLRLLLESRQDTVKGQLYTAIGFMWLHL
jgi:hypothetical protein